MSMTPAAALTLRHMDVVYCHDNHTVNRVDRVSQDKRTGRVTVTLIGRYGSWHRAPCGLSLVYRAEAIPPGVYVHLGHLRPAEAVVLQQAIIERQREQEQQEQSEGKER